MRRFSAITTAQLARICGVSQGTVDRALHGRSEINPKTKERILAVAREYGYAPRTKNAQSGKSMLIGAVLFDLYNAFFSKLAMSLVEKAKENGYSVIFQFSNKNPLDERAAIDYFNYIGVDGIILFPIGSDSSEYTEYLHSVARPIVTVGNGIEGQDYIGIDDEAAMYELTSKMLSECSGTVAYFAPILKSSLHAKNAQLLRLSGYKRAIRESGRRELILTEDSALSGKMSGIVCSTDHYLLRAIGKLGYDTGIKLAGFDNTVGLKSIGADVLTVEYSTDRIAEECIKYVLGRRYHSNIPYNIIKNNE